MFWWRLNTLSSVRRYSLRTSRNISRLQNLESLPSNSYSVCNNSRSNNVLEYLSFNKTCTNKGYFVMFSSDSPTDEVDHATYESVCGETLDSLCEFFEDIVERIPIFKTADVCFGDGVLTVNLENYGTYVINRQSPNKQIWLSSPISGPKRYDFVPSRNGWVYRHDNKTLHGLLQEELASLVKSPIDLSNCAYCGDFK